MKKRLLILMTVTGMIILLGGLLTYGLGVHEIIPVPRPDLIVVGTSLIGILLIVSGVCDLFVKKTKEMEIPVASPCWPGMSFAGIVALGWRSPPTARLIRARKMLTAL